MIEPQCGDRAPSATCKTIERALIPKIHRPSGNDNPKYQSDANVQTGRARNASAVRRWELRRRDFSEREMCLQVLYRLAVHLRVRIDKIIQGLTLLIR